jgi:hypothetical protein
MYSLLGMAWPRPTVSCSFQIRTAVLNAGERIRAPLIGKNISILFDKELLLLLGFVVLLLILLLRMGYLEPGDVLARFRKNIRHTKRASLLPFFRNPRGILCQPGIEHV